MCSRRRSTASSPRCGPRRETRSARAPCSPGSTAATRNEEAAVALHLIKLCVGCDTVEELVEWRRQDGRDGQPWKMRTRQTPKRAAELIEGGSLYRVFKGFVLCRQAITAVETVGAGPAARCEVSLKPQIVLTAPMPR